LAGRAGDRDPKAVADLILRLAGAGNIGKLRDWTLCGNARCGKSQDK
jgi:hypothetical protein